uniref:Uncharacterized protein n=1 Tax=Tanacetum cinerariifolium TaxID=118510 RepID=A0A6L2KRZ8_TANCI|nr:hypothetical protein [Tanacetum cinerariifolium]
MLAIGQVVDDIKVVCEMVLITLGRTFRLYDFNKFGEGCSVGNKIFVCYQPDFKGHSVELCNLQSDYFIVKK